MLAKRFRFLSGLLILSMTFSLVPPSAVTSVDALSYSGSSSYKSGKYYKNLINVQLTGDQRVDIVNIAKSQIGYQEGSSSSQLSGTAYGSKNYTEYGRWYGMQDMWCAMFVSWCANVAGIPKSVVPSHAYTPTGLQWFKDRGRAYSRTTVANGGYTPKPGDIIYFKSGRNSNPTNHVGIVTKYSNGTVYTVEGNTSSATISTNGGSTCSKSYSISNTYIKYICSPAYKTSVTGSSSSSSTENSLVPNSVKDIVFNADYYANKYSDLKKTFGTNATKLFEHYVNFGIKEGRQASPIFSIKDYVNNNSDLKKKYGTDYKTAMKHFVSFGIKEARNTAKPVNLGSSFYAKITGQGSKKNLSLADNNVIIYSPSDKPAQVWKFTRHSDGSYTITNQKDGKKVLSVADDSHKSGANVQIETSNSDSGQRWFIYSYDGKYVLRPVCASGRVLDVYGSKTADMTNVQTYTFNGTSAQKFSITKVDFKTETTKPEDNKTETTKPEDNKTETTKPEDNKTETTKPEDNKTETTKPENTAALELTDAQKALVFDATYYANNNADLKAKYGTDEAKLYAHFISTGLKEGRQGNAVFDIKYYLSSNADLKKAYGTDYVTGLKHYLSFGYKEARITAKPVDLGTNFYAKINIPGSELNLSLSDNNVIAYNNSNKPAQVWKFTKNSNGSYIITNQKTGKVLDVEASSAKSGANVQIYNSNKTSAQNWYIYQSDNGYVLRAGCSGGAVLDLEGASKKAMTNIQHYIYNGTSAQKFDIKKVDFLKTVEAENLGDSFYAKITSAKNNKMNLSLSDSNVILYTSSSKPAQVWKFVRQSDGSYKIINQKDGKKVLDVNGASKASKANVQIYKDNGSTAQRWFIYLKEGNYVLRPACATSTVLDVAGGTMADLTNIQTYALNGSIAQSFKIVKTNASGVALESSSSNSSSSSGSTSSSGSVLPDGVTASQMEVLRKIIYAVETGGQVYGNADYDDFTEAYTNTPEEHAITIGAGQWFGPEAKRLLNLIRQRDPAGFAKLDTAGIASDLDSKNWSTYKLSKSSAKAKCIQKIISSAEGIRYQDYLIDEQMKSYLKEAKDLGVTKLDAQMMCANLRHLGGLSAVKRVLGKTKGGYTLDNIYAALQTDTGNQVGAFRSRNKMVYNELKNRISK